MNSLRASRIFLIFLGLVGIVLCAVAPAWAAPTALSEQELAQVNGQGFVTLNNSSYSGLDFSTIALNVDVTLNANFKNIELGQYSAAPNGVGADISISLLQFGRSDGTAAQRLVQISNPYLQFVYDNTAVGHSQVVGMRLGFNGISGDLGLLANSISGSVLIDGGTAGVLDVTGRRWDNSTCVAPCLSLAQIGGVSAGNSSGPSRDFWLSILRQPVQFQAPAGSGLPDPAMAQAGYWLNWRDRLVATNITGTAPPNLALGH